MGRKELEAVVDFILNSANEAEFDVILKACERKQKDRALFSALGGLNPEKSAKSMAEGFNQAMGSSMESLRNSARAFVADMVLREVPDIPEEHLMELLKEYVPDPATKLASRKESLRPDALAQMVKQFVDYSEGRMPPSQQRTLWENVPDWKERYWEAFSAELRTLVKAYFDGKLDPETFWTAVYSLLGL